MTGQPPSEGASKCLLEPLSAFWLSRSSAQSQTRVLKRLQVDIYSPTDDFALETWRAARECPSLDSLDVCSDCRP